MKKLKVLLLLCSLVYISAVAVLLFKQRSFVFHPRARDLRTPADFSQQFQEITIPIEGQQISAWWIPQQEPSKAITVLYCHGNSASLSSLTYVSTLFYKYGWNALLFDYRGYGNSSFPSSGEISQESINRDANQVYDWLVSQNIDPNKLVVWGHSLGSAVAAQLTYQRPAKVVILEGTFPSIYKMARYRYPWALFPEWLLINKFDVSYYTQKSNVPKLFLHATKDRIIPFELGRSVFENATGSKELIILEDIGHNDFPDVESRYRERMKRFISKHIESSEIKYSNQ